MARSIPTFQALKRMQVHDNRHIGDWPEMFRRQLIPMLPTDASYLLSFAQGGPLDFSKHVGTGGMRVAGDGRVVRLPEAVSRLPLDGALRQYSPASGLAGASRVGAGAAHVSAASRCAIRALAIRAAGLARRRHQLDAGLSARRPAVRAGAAGADADSRAQRGAAQQPG